MSTNTTNIHSDIAKIFADIDALPRGHYLYLEEGDPFYRPRPERWVRPASELKSAGDLEVGSEHYFGRWYDRTGRFLPLAERGSDWWDTATEGMDVRLIKRTPHAVFRGHGDVLFVSDGRYVFTGEVEVAPGRVAYEFITDEKYWEDLQAEVRAQKEAWLAEHPEVAAAMPAWANESEVIGFDVSDLDNPEVEIIFSRQFDQFSISTVVVWVDGEIDHGTDPGPSFYVHNNEAIATVETLRRLADNILTAAEALEDTEPDPPMSAGAVMGARNLAQMMRDRGAKSMRELVDMLQNEGSTEGSAHGSPTRELRRNVTVDEALLNQDG